MQLLRTSPECSSRLHRVARSVGIPGDVAALVPVVRWCGFFSVLLHFPTLMHKALYYLISEGSSGRKAKYQNASDNL